MNSNKSNKKFCAGSKRASALLVSLVLLLCVTVGGTLAFLATKTETLNNVFTPSKVTTAVAEDITTDPAKKQAVKIENTGDTEAWIRATIVVNWQDANGNVYGKAPVKGTDYTMTLTEPKDGWQLAADGFYYWSHPVASGATTGVLISEATASAPITVDGTTYYLSIEIICSGIQSTPDAAVLESWKTGVSGVKTETTDGVTTRTLTVKTN